jgi:hypothetical protein
VVLVLSVIHFLRSKGQHTDVNSSAAYWLVWSRPPDPNNGCSSIDRGYSIQHTVLMLHLQSFISLGPSNCMYQGSSL